MAKNLTAKEFQEKQARRLKESLPDIERGIMNVTEAPGIKAAAKQEKMKRNLNAAIDSGKWADRVKSVSLPEWQKAALEKGLNRISVGIDQAADKVEAFAEQLLEYQKTALAKIEKMPDTTLEDSIARQAAWTREMAKFRRK